MNTEKAGFLILSMLLLSLSVSAMDIQLPATINPNSNFFFTTTLNSSDSFDKVEVYLDNQKLVDAYSNLQVISDPYNGNYVMKAFITDTDPNSNSGLQLIVSHLGVADGSHTIDVKAIKNNSMVDEKTATFSTGTNNIEDLINQKVNDKLSGFEETLTNFQNSLDLFGAQYTAIKNSFDSIQGANTNLQDSITALQNSLQALQGNVTQTQTDVQSKTGKLEGDVKQLQDFQTSQTLKEADAKKNNPFNAISGLATGAGNESQIGFGIVVIVVIVGAVLLIRRRKGMSIYRGISKGNNFDSNSLEQQLADQGSEDESGLGAAASGPKWMEAKKAAEEPKRFNLGDLIRK